jgi:hypothetical protein
MRSILSFRAASFGALLVVAFSDSLHAAEFGLEAELATEVKAPMVVHAAKDVEAFGPKIDEPSRGKFVWKAGKPATGGDGDHEGFARFVVQIPEAGKYAIWGRIIGWDGNSDSFWVTVIPPDPKEDPQKTQNTQFRWGAAQGPNWHWDRINHWLNGGTFDREWQLPKGPVEITIYTRETATMLDTLFLTTNLSPDEATVKPRVPTDAEVALQQGKTTAVEPRGKLTVTWASLRAQ